MPSSERQTVIAGEQTRRSRTARWFFLLGTAVLLGSSLGGAALVRLLDIPAGTPFRFPPVFWMSTVALATGSLALQRGVGFVRRERQRAFRGQLVVALVAGTVFVMLQIAGLKVLIDARELSPVAEAADSLPTIGVKPYVVVAAALHAMHFVVAILFLVYVTVNGFQDRYDHEVHFSVRFCAWFWHALGVIWLALLCVFGFVFL